MGPNLSQDDDPLLWKGRYLDSLDELERREGDWRRAEEQWRGVLSRLALAGYGTNPDLDPQLEALRDAIRRNRGLRDLEDLVAGLEQATTALKEPGGARPRSPQSTLARLLATLDLPPELERRGSALYGKLAASTTSREADDLIAQTGELLQKALDLGREPAPEEASGAARESPRPGLLQRLFKAREERDTTADDATAAPGPAANSAPAAAGARSPDDAAIHALETILGNIQLPAGITSELEDLRRRLQTARSARGAEALIPELTRLLNRALQMTAPAPGEAIPAPGVDPEPLPAHDALRKLLDRLDLPPSREAEREGLRRRLESPLTLDKLTSVIESMADLLGEISHELHQQHRDLEHFLRGITTRLREMEQHLAAAEQARIEAHGDGASLQRNIREQVASMRTSVDGATSLAGLKLAIVTGLDAVQGQMDTFIDREQRRNREAENRIRILNERLGQVETESNGLRERLASEREQAMHDPLTGLYNRLAYGERIQQEHARWKRHGAPLSLLVADIDHFKRLNDGFGHQAGDRVLRAVAQQLAGHLRESDVAARYGGEEFAILLPNTDRDAALGVAEKLRSTIEACAFHYRDTPVKVTISVGLTEFNGDDTPASAFERADQALYQAKRAGRNRCVAG